METIQKFKAKDGTIFDSAEKCLKYETLISQVELIMYKLNPLPKDDGCEFANGGGYIQQDKSVIDEARKALTDLGNTYFGYDKDSWSFYSIGRLFDDANIKCLYSAWSRLSNIDYLHREWGQGYYAANPTKGKQVPFTN